MKGKQAKEDYSELIVATEKVLESLHEAMTVAGKNKSPTHQIVFAATIFDIRGILNEMIKRNEK